jgi:hypothetical protein
MTASYRAQISPVTGRVAFCISAPACNGYGSTAKYCASSRHAAYRNGVSLNHMIALLKII